MIYKTISEYSAIIHESKDQPHTLADILLELGTKYAFLSDSYKEYKLKKNIYWQANKFTDEKPLSDKTLELSWSATKEGTEETRLTIELKSLEKLMSVLKTYLRVIENESRNLH